VGFFSCFVQSVKNRQVAGKLGKMTGAKKKPTGESPWAE
jgi:hypothetical protein